MTLRSFEANLSEHSVRLQFQSVDRAVRTALKLWNELGLASYMVFSDWQGVVEQLKNERVDSRSVYRA